MNCGGRNFANLEKFLIARATRSMTLGTLRNRTDEAGRRLEVARGLGRAREQ